MTVTMTVEEYNALCDAGNKDFSDYQDMFIKLLRKYMATGELETFYHHSMLRETMYSRVDMASEISNKIWNDFMKLVNSEKVKVKDLPSTMQQPEDTTPKKDKSIKRRRRERKAA